MNNCGSFKRQLADYVVGGLSAAERQAVAQHLAVCPRCAAEVQALQQVGRWLDETPPADPPPFLWSRVRQELLAQSTAPSRPWWQALLTWPRPVYLSLAVALLVFALTLLQPRLPEPVAADDTSPAPYVARHHLASWNDPLHDKVLAGWWLAEGP